jgi:type 1 glutamine amidotransferase
MIPGAPSFAGLKAFPAAEPIQEEWYSLKDFAPDLHVILAQDTTGMTGNDYNRPNYPATWAHLYGKGRVFYTSLGHREDVWTSPEYQALLLAGINWSSGRIDADVPSNIAQVTPEANKLPPYKAPEKKAESKKPTAPAKME